MAKKESSKPKSVRLPAIGKPKPKPKKTSIKALGTVANSDFKKGYSEKDKRTIGFDLSKAKTAKEEALRAASAFKERKRFTYSDKTQEEITKRKLARITGV